MKCFYHRNADAVGACKNCGRGLCPECLVDVGQGLACHGRCEDEVRSLNRVIEQNKRAYQKTSGAYNRAGIFYGLVGIFFVAAGMLNPSGLGWLFIPGGFIFFAAAFVQFWTARKFERD